MAVNYSKFEMPESIRIDEATKTDSFTRFIAEPLERGFGHTLGNFLRRVLYTSLEAPAILSIRIEDVPHEFTAVDGIIEDMTHVILNLKGALLRRLPMDTEKRTRENKLVTKTLEITEENIDKGNGSYQVKLKDILGPSDFEMINPDLLIFTATKPMNRRVDVRIGYGRGYVPSEKHDFDKMTDEIVLDTTFSPIKLVNYFVENTRVGQDMDYDKLILDVTTDARITPQEALMFSTQIGTMHLQVFDNLKQHEINFEEEQIESNKDRDELLQKLALKIDEIELSVRSTNCLAGANIDTIGELVVMPESDMLRFRNFGKKSLTEIKQKLDEMGLSLGMDLSRYGINKDNVKEVVENYLEEKQGSEA